MEIFGSLNRTELLQALLFFPLARECYSLCVCQPLCRKGWWSRCYLDLYSEKWFQDNEGTAPEQSFKFAVPRLLPYFVQVTSSPFHLGSIELKNKKALCPWLDRCTRVPIPDQRSQFPKVRLENNCLSCVGRSKPGSKRITHFPPHFLEAVCITG